MLFQTILDKDLAYNKNKSNFLKIKKKNLCICGGKKYSRLHAPIDAGLICALCPRLCSYKKEYFYILIKTMFTNSMCNNNLLISIKKSLLDSLENDALMQSFKDFPLNFGLF